MTVTRRWGPDHQRLDDDAARRRLLEAASRCIIRRGNTEIRMAEVADEAAVARSTVYRYFATRDELLLGLVLARVDAAAARWVAALQRPQDAASSIRELVLNPVAAVDDGDRLNRALYASESKALASVLALGAEPLVDVACRHYAPLLEQWSADGQLYPDLDFREIVHWINTATSFLLTPSWRYQPANLKLRFVNRYLVRALLQREPSNEDG